MLERVAELLIFGIAPLIFGGLLMPGTLAAEEIAMTGEVSYRERIALPPNAMLTVRLSDVSLADAPESVIAEQKIDPAGQVADTVRDEVRSGGHPAQLSYALQARITVDDTLWFINDERYQIDPLKPEPDRLVLKMVQQEGNPARERANHPPRTGGMITFGSRQARRSISGQGRKPSSFVRQILTSRKYRLSQVTATPSGGSVWLACRKASSATSGSSVQ